MVSLKSLSAITLSWTRMSLARVAVITGAARGIGRAIALRLARDGLDVVVNDVPHRAQELDMVVADIRSKSRKGIAVLGDVSCESDVQRLTNTAVKELGGLDVMVANAGIALFSPLSQTSVEHWDRMQSINVRGAFLCYKAAALQMIKQGRGGRIIGAASIASKQGTAAWGSYSTTKFAVRGLTQSAAAEWGQYGITVNAYAPGAVDTPLMTDINKSRKAQALDEILCPVEKLISPEDVAGLVSYLVGDESKFITGQSLNINDGVYFD